ncbi:MAG: hypothetical protein LBQ69_04135 [Treponema sp.]|jgi:hypothetical protein|nr:hypothetical protein [Treponema sp.]
MIQSNKSRKTSIIGIVIASVCILVYLGALVSVIVRINTSMANYRLVAEQEFYDLADLASSAGVFSFMDETFIEIIQSALERSRTLEGIIISGPNGEYGFEKERGRAIGSVNGSPRFRNRFDFSRESLYLPLRIQGLRNINIQAVAGALDYGDLVNILKQAILLIASALAVAFFTLIMESLHRDRGLKAGRLKSERPARAEAGKDTQPDYAAGGSYSQRGHVVRQENTETRLTEELRRCAAAGLDLAFIAMEFKPSAEEESFYPRFAADAARFFSSRDFICEKGERGISVICPGLNLDTGFLNADEFHNRVMGKYPGLFKSKTDLCMGISARSGRPINARRLMFEAEEALERALMDPVSHIVAFKSDPEKYRAFMESRGQGE